MQQNKRITYVKIENYRSIKDEISIRFPISGPLVLLGENNAGKTNIIKAIDLVLGEFWPGSHKPEDHEFWNREPYNFPISIKVGMSGVEGKYSPVSEVHWTCDDINSEPNFNAHYEHSAPTFVNNLIRDQLCTIMIGADRRLSYQMSYASKWTFLSKLMRKFHKRLIADNNRVDRLKEKFIEIKEIFQEVDEFSGFQTELQNQFSQMLSNMTYQLGIDFSAYDPSNYFQSLKVFPSENNMPRTFEEIGTGQEQILAIAFAHAYAKAFYGGIVLIIEEPEAHLHPLAQQWLGKKVHEMSRDGLQVILSTHSPAFLDILNLPGLCYVRKEDDENSTWIKQNDVKQITDFCLENKANPEKTTETSILPFYATNSTQEILSGFFAKKIILVEGQTEYLALPEYLRKVDLEVEMEGIAFIPVFGKGNLAKWWRLFRA